MSSSRRTLVTEAIGENIWETEKSAIVELQLLTGRNGFQFVPFPFGF